MTGARTVGGSTHTNSSIEIRKGKKAFINDIKNKINGRLWKIAWHFCVPKQERKDEKVEKENKEKGKVKNLVRNATKENVRNNSNSISCNDCSFINIGRDNNKFSV